MDILSIQELKIKLYENYSILYEKIRLHQANCT